MKNTLRTVFLTALALIACSSFVFADIAPLPDPGPGKSRIGILVALAAVIAALLIARAAIRKKRGK